MAVPTEYSIDATMEVSPECQPTHPVEVPHLNVSRYLQEIVMTENPDSDQRFTTLLRKQLRRKYFISLGEHVISEPRDYSFVVKYT